MLDVHLRSRFPTEVLVEIFGHLGFHDLLQLLKVNSYFRAVAYIAAEPQVYDRGILTEYGIGFPLAEHSYPFFDCEDLDTELGREAAYTRKVSVAVNLRCLDLKPHSPSDCEALYQSFTADVTNPGMPSLRFHLGVLSIQLHSPLRISDVPPQTLHNIAPESSDGQDHCDVLDTFKWASYVAGLNSLVVRHMPLPIYADRKPQFWPSKFVSILLSRKTLPPAAEVGECTNAHAWGLDVMGMLGVGNVAHAVIVFWTDGPGETWLPPCTHELDPDAEDTTTIWHHLAYAGRLQCSETLTIVNAGAVVPDICTQELHELRLQLEVAAGSTAAQDECYRAFASAADAYGTS